MEEVVLLVDGRDVADEYARLLGRRYDVLRASTARDALERVADAAAVLVSDDVAGAGSFTASLYADSHAAGVGLLTDGTDRAGPVPHDERLLEPVDDETLFDTVDSLFDRASFSRDLHRLYAVATRIGALESRFDPERIADSPEYERLRSTLECLDGRLAERIGSCGARCFHVAAGPPLFR